MTRPSRLDYALDVADVVATRAACTRRQVGAVTLDPAGLIIGTGYNGAAAGAVHCTDGGCPRGAMTYEQVPGMLGNTGHPVACIALHAEDNATARALELIALRRFARSEITAPADCLVAITCPPCPPCEQLLRDGEWGTVTWRLADRNGTRLPGLGGWGDLGTTGRWGGSTYAIAATAGDPPPPGPAPSPPDDPDEPGEPDEFYTPPGTMLLADGVRCRCIKWAGHPCPHGNVSPRGEVPPHTGSWETDQRAMR